MSWSFQEINLKQLKDDSNRSDTKQCRNYLHHQNKNSCNPVSVMKVSGTRLLLSYNEICNVILGSPYQIQVSFKDLLRFDVILSLGVCPAKKRLSVQ